MRQEILTKFLPGSKDSNLVSRLPSFEGAFLFPLDFYGYVFCEKCGEVAVKAGWRYNSCKEKVQRYHCRKCNNYFEIDFNAHSHQPQWVFDRIDSAMVRGLSYSQIPNEVRREGRNRQDGLTISIPTVYEIVKKSNILLEEIEAVALRILATKKPPSKTWLIDERYHTLPKRRNKGTQMQILDPALWKCEVPKKSRKLRRKRQKERFMYAIAVVEQESGFCFSVVVSKNKDFKAAVKALALAARRAGYDPNLIRCDAHKPSAQAARMLFPGALIISHSKDEKIECINEIEVWFSGVSRTISKHRFRAFKPLDNALNLYRHHRNLLESYSKKTPNAGRTPAEVLGIWLPPEIKNEQDFKFLELLRFARKFLNIVRAFQAKKWFVSS